LKYLVAATLAFSFLLSAHLAQAVRPDDEVARVVRAEMAKQKIPGLALLVSRKGVPIRAEGFGLASAERGGTPQNGRGYPAGVSAGDGLGL
jgi:hypothetical protein